jgi:hypothetical protein
MYLLVDTRGIEGTEKIQFLNLSEIKLLFQIHPEGCECDIKWACSRKLLGYVDRKWIPLAIASVRFLKDLETQFGRSCKRVRQPLRVFGAAA